IFKRAPLAVDPDSRAMKDGHHNAIVIDGEPQQTGEADYAKSIANTPADIGDILAFEHNEDFDYVLADVTRAYDPDKVAACTRQFVYLRPDCFVVFDRVFTKDDGPRKEWVINTYGTIAVRNDVAVIDGGLSKLFVEVLLPDDAVLETSRPEGSWRKKVSRLSVRPRLPAREDYFLHVLFATAGEDEVPEAKLVRDGERVGAEVTYRDRVYRTLFDKTTGPGGHMTIIDSGGKKLANRDFTDRILEPS
ncbi:MAG: hypothetical protein ACE5JM_14900, partial [Armatimonadota bacterium]